MKHGDWRGIFLLLAGRTESELQQRKGKQRPQGAEHNYRGDKERYPVRRGDIAVRQVRLDQGHPLEQHEERNADQEVSAVEGERLKPAQPSSILDVLCNDAGNVCRSACR